MLKQGLPLLGDKPQSIRFLADCRSRATSAGTILVAAIRSEGFKIPQSAQVIDNTRGHEGRNAERAGDLSHVSGIPRSKFMQYTVKHLK
jgi:hypothetical protein